MFISGWPVTKRLYLMQGVPGSGKSTMAEMIQADLRSKEMQAVIYSTDDWRYAEGKYVYDPETNKVFHQECQKATIRAMQQATYDVTNIGHFGLGATDYVHFTSPIRRYPDLAVHRTLRKMIRTTRPSRRTNSALVSRP